MSVFVNFKVECLKKIMMMMKKLAFYEFPCTVVAVDFTYFESLTMYRNTRRAGCVSKKA